MAPHKVFVCAATGTQGGAVARQLRAIGWEVSTTTRNPNSAEAQALTSIGVNVCQADWADTSSLEAALAGCGLLFLNMVPDWANPTNEATQGKNMLNIAKAAGVTHVVYTSGFSTPEIDAMPYVDHFFACKGVLETAVQEAGFRHWTILLPGFFMANFLSPKVQRVYPGAVETGEFALALQPDTELLMIDHDDIAAAAIAAFREPERFHGHRVDLISETVTVERAVEAMRRGTGRNIRAKYLTDDEAEAAKAANPMFVLHDMVRVMAKARGAEAGTRAWGLPTSTFEAFVEREREAFEETFRNVSG